MPAPDLPPAPTFDQPTQRPLHVHLHTHDVTPEQLAGGVAIVIDAIRASVTITKALAEGATAIAPCLTADDARAKAHDLRRTHPRVLLGGERGGVLIEGFDLDNSPASYTRERIAAAAIAFTTSNGTAGLLHAQRAARVLVGSFANVDALCTAVAHDPRPVHILCCGTRHELSMDDCLPAGAMVEKLFAAGREPSTDDAARFSLLAWHAVRDDPAKLRQAMRDSRGGRNLVRIGLGADVDYCAALNTLPIVPEFDPATGLITRA